MTSKQPTGSIAGLQETAPKEAATAAVDPQRRNTPAAPPPLPAPGFSARLRGETLFDLIQFECLQGSSKIVRVTSGERSGFLFFRQGNLVHATLGGRAGEEALRALLRWDRGAFEAWDGAWPAEESITLPYQTLLLRATAEMDERGESPRILSFSAKDPGPQGGGDDVSKRMPTGGAAPVEVVRLAPGGDVTDVASHEALVERTV